MTRTVAVVATALLAAPSRAPAQAPKLPDGVTARTDLAYGPHKERNLVDLWVPKSDAPVPLVIWVHGGAWQGGNKGANNPAMPLLARGYAVAAINYRLSQHALFPAQIHDCKAAVRFLRANAGKYNLNPDAFGVWGASAGGHLVALLGTSGDVKDLEGDVGGHAGVSSRVQCVVDFFGPTDLTRMAAQSGPNGKFDHDSPNSPESKLLGGPVQEKKDLAARANPLTHVTGDDPPVLILHGDADPLVPVGQSEILRDAYQKAGLGCELVVIKGGGHGGKDFASAENRRTIDAFLDRNLKKK